MKLNSAQRVGIFLVIFILSLFAYGYLKTNSLKANYKKTIGVVEKYNRPGGPGKANIIDITYGYMINGKKYTDVMGYDATILSRDLWEQRIIGHPVLVLYDTTNYGNSEALILPNDYMRHKMSYPDSLQWILSQNQ